MAAVWTAFYESCTHATYRSAVRVLRDALGSFGGLSLSQRDENHRVSLGGPPKMDLNTLLISISFTSRANDEKWDLRRPL